ncbi:hypothetical protein K1719_034245 [Acacia pycnantha]|nr:hypothetical protein K1719_034245 [Acacia pycnantha]
MFSLGQEDLQIPFLFAAILVSKHSTRFFSPYFDRGHKLPDDGQNLPLIQSRRAPQTMQALILKNRNDELV